MARTKKQETTELAPVTRAEKKDATKKLITTLLAEKPYKHNELIEEVAKIYAERYAGEDTENINDVKGRVGSVLDIMKKDSDIMYDGGMYALKARMIEEPPVKKPQKKTKTVKEETARAEEEAPAPKKRGRKPKAEKKEEETMPLPPAPIQPIAPVAPITPEVAPEPIPKQEEAPAPKKRGRKPKAKAEETPAEPETKLETPPAEEKPQEDTQLIVKEKAEVAKQSVVMDMSFLFGERKPAPQAEKKEAVKTEEKGVKTEEKPQPKPEVKPLQKTEKKPLAKPVTRTSVRTVRKPAQKPMTADEKLCEEFLKRMRKLGGEYFEYYSVYLLERYSMKNGRRLEGMKISGGDRDGGIDGEIELTDKLGFRETIYIQSKNWNPEKGDEKLWVVGETLLQQFIGACVCRQARDKKQNCRGIFITTSRFTPDAKRLLDEMSDKIVGYDGEDLFEAAKECSFGVIEKNGAWVLDEKLLSGTKAFFNLY